MKNPNLQTLGLSSERFAWLLRKLRKTPEALDIADRVYLRFASILEARRVVSADERDRLLSFAATAVREAVQRMQADNSKGLVSITDGTFVCVSGSSGYLDLRSGETVEALAEMPVEIVTYNLGMILTMVQNEAEHMER